MSLNCCLWEGPDFLRLSYCLKDIYPSNRRLFCDILGVKDVRIENLVNEVAKFQRGTDLSYMSRIFLEMEKFLQKDSRALEPHVARLRGQRIYPTRNNELDRGYSQLQYGNPWSNYQWFIADRRHLNESFRGKVQLLAFSVEQIIQMPYLLRALGCDGRRLSKAAKSVPVTKGSVNLHQEYIASLRPKAHFILR